MKDNETLLKDLQAELNDLNEKIVKLVAFLHGKEERQLPRSKERGLIKALVD